MPSNTSTGKGCLMEYALSQGLTENLDDLVTAYAKAEDLMLTLGPLCRGARESVGHEYHFPELVSTVKIRIPAETLAGLTSKVAPPRLAETHHWSPDIQGLFLKSRSTEPVMITTIDLDMRHFKDGSRPGGHLRAMNIDMKENFLNSNEAFIKTIYSSDAADEQFLPSIKNATASETSATSPYRVMPLQSATSSRD